MRKYTISTDINGKWFIDNIGIIGYHYYPSIGYIHKIYYSKNKRCGINLFI
jgi:hypothetical protein